MPQDGAFVFPHTGPQTLTSFPDIMNRTLAAFKVVDFSSGPRGSLGRINVVRGVVASLYATDMRCLDKRRGEASIRLSRGKVV